MMSLFKIVVFSALVSIHMSTSLQAQGSLLLVGGGGEDYSSWSDQPYGWFVARADSGKIINIDVDAASSWYPGYFESLGAAEGCEALRISSRSQANDSSVYRKLISARGIFMEGGDQWDYVSTWQGTLVEDAIHKVFSEGGAIGGTSAGLAVLGSISFDAKYGSSYPEEVVYNPYNSRVHFTDDFLEILPMVLTDSHFFSRGRIGRLVPMLARRIQDNGEEQIMGIGVSDKTALCIDQEGIARSFGIGSITLLYRDALSEIICETGTPLSFTNIRMDQLVHGAVYDLNKKELLETGPYMSATSPAVFAGTFRDTVVNGSDAGAAALGEIEVYRLTNNELDAWRGNLRQKTAEGVIPGTLIMPKIWNNNDYYENRWVGGIWGGVTNPGITVVYVDDNTQCQVDDKGILTVDKLAHILETKDALYAGVSNYAKTNYSGIIGGRLHFLNHGQQYDLANQSLVSISDQESAPLPDRFRILNSYPNPFNNRCQITFSIPSKSDVVLDIYGLDGRRILSMQEAFSGEGEYRMSWEAGAQASGVYIFRLSSDYGTDTVKGILLK